mgnify:CR=1 FL=1
MNDNNIETQYDLTKKSKFRIFYDSNKTAIYSIVLVLVILISSLIFYIDHKKKKVLLLSNKYIQAKIYIESENSDEALNISAFENLSFHWSLLLSSFTREN